MHFINIQAEDLYNTYVSTLNAYIQVIDSTEQYSSYEEFVNNGHGYQSFVATGLVLPKTISSSLYSVVYITIKKATSIEAYFIRNEAIQGVTFWSNFKIDAFSDTSVLIK